jgi:magnesium transporter
MAETEPLSLAFIDRRPHAAARALSAMEAEDAAAFLEGIPTRFLSRALSHMSGWSAAGIVARMNADAAAAGLRGLRYQTAAAILRLMEPRARVPILEALPASTRRDFRTTLSFPADTVGAHMTAGILAQRRDHDVADARDQVRRATRADAGCLVVVDDDHRLAGLVSPVALLRWPGTTPLAEIMDTDVTALSARARLTTVTGLHDWDRYASLPVLSRRKHVIGVLSRTNLRDVLSVAEAGQAPASQGLPVSLADALVGVLAGLARLLEQASPPRDETGGPR